MQTVANLKLVFQTDVFKTPVKGLVVYKLFALWSIMFHIVLVHKVSLAIPMTNALKLLLLILIHAKLVEQIQNV